MSKKKYIDFSGLTAYHNKLKSEIESTYVKQEGEYPNLIAGHAKNLDGIKENINSSGYRPVAGNDDIKNGAGSIERIQGNSIAWNQLVQNGNFANGVTGWNFDKDVTISASGNVLTINRSAAIYNGGVYHIIDTTNGHKYAFLLEIKGYKAKNEYNIAYIKTKNYAVSYTKPVDTTWKRYSFITGNSNPQEDVSLVYLYNKYTEIGEKVYYRNIQLFDLTLIYGIGNEPTTPEQFEADYQRWFGRTLDYEEYDAGSIRTTLATGIKTVGFNLYADGDYKGTYAEVVRRIILWDNKCNYKGQLQLTATIKNVTTGEITYISGLSRSDRTVDYIYRNNGNSADLSDLHLGIAVQYTDGSALWLGNFAICKSRDNNFEVTNICINFVHSGIRNGDYEPHWEETKALPITTLTGKLDGKGNSVVIFPDGLKRAGTICDEIYEENGVTKAIKRVGSVDLGTLNWTIGTPQNTNRTQFFRAYFTCKLPQEDRSIPNIVSSKYTTIDYYTLYWGTDDKIISIVDEVNNSNSSSKGNVLRVVDSSYTDATAFKNSLNGVIAYYELEEPQTYIVDNFQLPAVYKVDDFGTEEIIQPVNSIAPTMTIKYGLNAVDAIRRLDLGKISEVVSKVNGLDATMIPLNIDAFVSGGELVEELKENSIDTVNKAIDQFLMYFYMLSSYVNSFDSLFSVCTATPDNVNKLPFRGINLYHTDKDFTFHKGIYSYDDAHESLKQNAYIRFIIQNEGSSDIKVTIPPRDFFASGETVISNEESTMVEPNKACEVTAIKIGKKVFVRVMDCKKFPYESKEIYAYGVEFDTTVSSPDVTRIGNTSLHRTLPVHSRMRGCLLDDNGDVVKYLDSNDWTNETRDGSIGQVMVEIPCHYVRFEEDGTKRRVWLSEYAIDGFTRVPKMYVSAYEAALDRDTNTLASVVNTSTRFRGGNNSPWDGGDNSLLGMPVTSTSRTNFRAYARKRKSNSSEWNCMTYDMQKTLYWLFVVEYATLNSQATYNAALTTEGFRQGGLGLGVTEVDSNLWSNWNNYNPFVPCGYTDKLGNNTGVVEFEIPWYHLGGKRTVYVPRYRGVENPFGHIWQWTDGINVRINPDSDNGGNGLSEVFVCSNPKKFNDNDYNGYTNVGNEARAEGYVKEMIFGKGGEIIPSAVGGGSSTYFCDYHYTTIPTVVTLRGVLFGGHATYGSRAGFVYAASDYVPSGTNTSIGSRLCFIPE